MEAIFIMNIEKYEKLQIESFFDSKYYKKIFKLAQTNNCEVKVEILDASKSYHCFYYSELHVSLIKDDYLLNSSYPDDEEGAMQAWTGLVMQSKKTALPQFVSWTKDEEFIFDIDKIIDLMEKKLFQKSKLKLNCP